MSPTWISRWFACSRRRTSDGRPLGATRVPHRYYPPRPAILLVLGSAGRKHSPSWSVSIIDSVASSRRHHEGRHGPGRGTHPRMGLLQTLALYSHSR
jgi:hypothetical protein